MNAIRLELDNATSFLVNGELDEVNANVPAAQKALEAQTYPGNDFLGWMHLPSSITPEFLSESKPALPHCVSTATRLSLQVSAVPTSERAQ